MARGGNDRDTERQLREEIERLKARLQRFQAGQCSEIKPVAEVGSVRELIANSPSMSQVVMGFTVDRMSDPTYWIQPDAQIVYVNDAATRLTGYSRQELLGMRIYELNPEVPEASWGQVWKQLADANQRTFETRHRAKDGTLIPVEIAANYLEFDGLAFSCAFVRDIRDRKRLETRLRHAEKMEAIGQLAGGIAHDFNNQLMGIMGCADLLQRELPDDENLSELVDNILLSVNRSAELTAQLLAFSRKGKYSAGSVNLHELIREVVELLSHSLDKKIAIERELAAEQAGTLGDGSQLQSALLNMALNARDAMPEGGTLKFKTENVDCSEAFASEHGFPIRPGRYVKVSVSDTGLGISPEVQKRIFEPFFTTKSDSQGSGLGLAAVYGTVKNHRGAVRVKSSPGTGTTLELFLPVSEANTRQQESESRANPADGTAHVMVVEDEPALRDVTRRMLESLGYSVTTFESGDQAVEYYRGASKEVDLVILDMVMPVMNGRETFRALCSINPDVKALLASGYSLDGDAQAIVNDGVLGFLQKPYGRSALAARIAEVLGKHQTDPRV